MSLKPHECVKMASKHEYTVPFSELYGRHTRPTLQPQGRGQRSSWVKPPLYSYHVLWQTKLLSGTDQLGWASQRRSSQRTLCGCTSSELGSALYWDQPLDRQDIINVTKRQCTILNEQPLWSLTMQPSLFQSPRSVSQNRHLVTKTETLKVSVSLEV